MQYLGPILSLGALGLLFGVVLAFASQKFAVEVDPRAEEVAAVLPGANCGACGYPGCSNYAKAVAEGEKINLCSVGGSAVSTKIASIMGVESVDTGEKKVARVLCQGGSRCKDEFEYTGLETCFAMNLVSGGPKACKEGCLGCGDCIKACKFGAIKMDEYGVAEIIRENCVGCEQCVAACPKNIIEMVPFTQNTYVNCKNRDGGAVARKACEKACIACKQCEKACNFDAIHVENNVARIDYSKCTDCMACFKVCPTNAITVLDPSEKKAEVIEEKCIGCTICAKNCPVSCIDGELKQVHHVREEECIGCGICKSKCPKDAINMKTV